MNGSFMVFRKLEQDVQKWSDDMDAEASARNVIPALVGAKIIGRWQSGCPINLSPNQEDRSKAFANTFQLDQKGDICPMGSHIRKMQPDRGSESRRILRRGITYGEDFKYANDKPGKGTRGLLFVCYQSSIETGFQFMQQFWANNTSFAGANAGVDP